MVKTTAATPEAYLDGLPPERREVMAAVRRVVLDNLPPGYTEAMRWGMICYEVPLERFPNTYNRQPLGYAALAAQKNYYSLYLTSVYQDSAAEGWLKAEFQKAGKKLDMGKSCVRFKRLEDLPLDVIGQAIASCPVDEFINGYQQSRQSVNPSRTSTLA